MDPSKRIKGIDNPTAQRDLKLIFAGQQVNDTLKDYRLKKKIIHVSTQLETQIKREKIAAKPAPTDGNTAEAPVLRSVPIGTTLLVKNFDKIMTRFEEHDPVFSSITRQKIDD